MGFCWGWVDDGGGAGSERAESGGGAGSGGAGAEGDDVGSGCSGCAGDCGVCGWAGGKSGEVQRAADSSASTERSRASGLGFSFYGLLGPYRRPKVPELFAGAGARLGGLIRDGKLYLSLHDAIALAIENNLDVEVERYNLQLADADALRAGVAGVCGGSTIRCRLRRMGLGGRGVPC